MKGVSINSRGKWITVFIVTVFLIFLFNLFNLQIFRAEDKRQAAVKSANVEVSAPRGEIYDRNGYPLATNKQVNSVIIDYLTFPSSSQTKERNERLSKLIDLFQKHGIEWNDELPIEIKGGKLSFTDDETSVSYLKSDAFLDLNYYATVQNCFDALCERYDLQGYSMKKARDIASVYYSMTKDGFNPSTPYIFAEDVDESVVNVLKERSDEFGGVDIEITSERQYFDGSIAPHVLGIVGKISTEELKANEDKGYKMNDMIGKNGIEYAYESYLRGTPGVKSVTVDANGTKTEKYVKEPIPGNDIVLTIDYNSQKTAQDALRDTIVKMSKDEPAVNAGAVVVMDAKTNEILACANYPSFNLDTYYDDYNSLFKDSRKPLWDRALRSAYTPGSTIKLAVAMAGLEEKKIDGDTIIRCTHTYTHYKDYQPTCTGWHGNQNVVYALFNSCNIFFYETSRLLGIDKLNSYFAMFGLGEETGVELPETTGMVDSVAYRNSIGDIWTPGLTIQAGIGHAGNQFSPVQLCSYVSTVANEGKRYKAHFVKKIKTSDHSETVLEQSTEFLSQADFKKENWKLVKDGMRLVGDNYFSEIVNMGIPVCAKTGTTTIRKESDNQKEVNNGLSVSFAPADDPQICVAVVIEGATSGGSTTPVARAVMKEYFSRNGKGEVNQYEGTLLG